MRTFRRGLDDEFVELLNEEYDRGRWWRGLVQDKELYIAIRDNCVNVYYRGCSLLECRRQGETLVGRIHYKYLLRPDLHTKGDPHITVKDGVPDFQGDLRHFFIENLGCREALKNAAKPYVGNEKEGVFDIIRANENVLDVEIALGKDPQPEEDGKPKEGRVDLAVLRKTTGGIDLVFFEMKHFSNPELRAKGTEPKVAKQVRRYARLLNEKREAIEQGYRKVCWNLLNIRGLADRYPIRHELLSSIADGSEDLSVNVAPRLVVFGFDQDQKKGDYWQCHLSKLKDRIGPKNLLLRGNSKNFTKGISTRL